MTNSNDMDDSNNSAFIFYRPEKGKSKEELFYNEEARRLIDHSTFVSENATAGDHPSPFSFWVELINNKITQGIEEGEETATTHFLDIIRSGKRRYIVKGACLTATDSAKESPKQYIFVIDRFGHPGMNLPQMFREWNLTKREQDMVGLLFDGLGNKEIAHNLNLSVNTVKSYMKLLSRKVGGAGRIGIIHSLLAGKKKKEP